MLCACQVNDSCLAACRGLFVDTADLSRAVAAGHQVKCHPTPSSWPPSPPNHPGCVTDHARPSAPCLASVLYPFSPYGCGQHVVENCNRMFRICSLESTSRLFYILLLFKACRIYYILFCHKLQIKTQAEQR